MYLLILSGVSGEIAAKGESETLLILRATNTASGGVGNASNALAISSRFIGVPSTGVRPGRAAKEESDRTSTATLWPLDTASSTIR